MKSLRQKEHPYLLHDPNDIRKHYFRQLENLGKVDDLNDKVISGYSSFNTVYKISQKNLNEMNETAEV